MSKMYVGYDGNFGSAEEYDLAIFDTDDLTEEQLSILDEDPTEFYFRLTGNNWEEE